MTAVNIAFRFHLAWWAKPLGYAVAFTSFPFVGEKRALFYATKVACRGIRITAAADSGH